VLRVHIDLGQPAHPFPDIVVHFGQFLVPPKSPIKTVCKSCTIPLLGLTVVRKNKSNCGLQKLQTVILRLQNVLSKVSWKAHLGPVLYKKTRKSPDPSSHTNQPQPTLDFNAMITIFGSVAKIRVRTSSLVVTSKRGPPSPKKQQKQQTSTPD